MSKGRMYALVDGRTGRLVGTIKAGNSLGASALFDHGKEWTLIEPRKYEQREPMSLVKGSALTGRHAFAVPKTMEYIAAEWRPGDLDFGHTERLCGLPVAFIEHALT